MPSLKWIKQNLDTSFGNRVRQWKPSRVKKNSFYAEVIDERMNHLKKHEVLSVIGCVPNNSAKFMVGEEEYNKLQEIYKENKKNEKNIKSSRESS